MQVSMPASSSSFGKGRIILLLLFATAIFVFLYFDLKQYFSLESLKAHRDGLLAFTEQHYAVAVALFIVSYCALVAVSLPGAVFFTLAGGLLFGSVVGTFYVNLGATSGSTLAFLASRYLLHDWVEAKFGARLGPLQEGFSKNAFSYLLTLRLIPVFPLFIVNTVSGLTKIRLKTFVIATALGIIPGSFVYAYVGRQLGTINSLSEIASPRVLLAFTLLGLLALVPTFYRKMSPRQGV